MGYRGCTSVAVNGYNCVNWMTVLDSLNWELTDELKKDYGKCEEKPGFKHGYGYGHGYHG